VERRSSRLDSFTVERNAGDQLTESTVQRGEVKNAVPVVSAGKHAREENDSKNQGDVTANANLLFGLYLFRHSKNPRKKQKN
jgi:hypothetical protein